MFKLIIFSLLLNTSILNAKNFCYSIELWSVLEKHYNKEVNGIYKNECEVLKIGNYYSMRCGCNENKKDIKNIDLYKKQYKNAYIVKTLKSRFSNKHSIKNKKNILTIAKVKNNVILSSKIDNIFTNQYSFNLSKDLYLPKIEEDLFLEDSNMLNSINLFSKNNKKIINQITNTSDFVGFSIEGKYDQYAYSDYINREYTDYEYNFKLKFDFLKNGYYENKIKKNEQLNSSNVLYYQNLINLNKYNFDENLAKLENITAKINILFYNELINIYGDAIKRKRILLKHGTETRYEVNSLIYEKNKFISLRNIYQQKNEPINKDIYNLLYLIDTIQLVDFTKIIKITSEKNTDILIESAKLNIYNSKKSFYDDVSLNVYSSVRSMDEVGWYSTVGAEVSIPLNFTSSDITQYNKLQKHSIEIKKNILIKHLNNSLKILYEKFYEFQSLIVTNKNNIENLYLQLADFKTIAKYNLPNLKVDFEQKIFTIQNTIIKIKYDNSLKRVKMLEIILNISYLSSIYDIKKLTVEQK